jgi:FMN phosphatase YigB (HAD superfamily)
MSEIWEDFNQVKPEREGYYMIRYRHKDDNVYYKAVWWNEMTKEFKYKDYIKEVLEFINDRYDYYIPCTYQDHSMELK